MNSLKKAWKFILLNKKIIISVCLLLISFFTLLHTSPVQSTTYVNQSVTVLPGHITYWNITVNDNNSVATITFSCNNCNITFFVITWTNYTIIKNNPLQVNFNSYKIANYDNVAGLTNQKVQLGLQNTFDFALVNDGLLSKTVTMYIDIGPPPIGGIQQILDLFPYIFVIFVIGVVAFFGYNRFRLTKSKVKEQEKNSPSIQPAEAVIVTSNKKIPVEILQKYWMCPNDSSRLQLVTERVAGSPTFTITKERVDNGINNAIAIRKIHAESADQTGKLVNEIFSQFEIEEIMLVNTRCPTCNKYFTAPQI